MPASCSSLGTLFFNVIFYIFVRVNPASVCVWQNTEKTPIEVAAKRSNEYLFNILAPLMKGTEALKNSINIINKSKIKELVELIEDDGENPSSEFKELLSSVPADLVRAA